MISGGFFEPLEGWRGWVAGPLRSLKDSSALRLCRFGSEQRSSAEFGRGVGEDRLASCSVGATMAEARAMAVSVHQQRDIGAPPPPTKSTGPSNRSAPNQISAGVGGAKDSGHSARDTLAPPTPHSFLRTLYPSMTRAFLSNPIFIFPPWMSLEV
jgi:hypothetical protein